MSPGSKRWRSGSVKVQLENLVNARGVWLDEIRHSGRSSKRFPIRAILYTLFCIFVNLYFGSGIASIIAILPFHGLRKPLAQMRLFQPELPVREIDFPL